MHCYTTYNNLYMKWNSMEYNLYITQYSEYSVFSGGMEYNGIIKIDQCLQLKK